jgi:hypothetical protein
VETEKKQTLQRPKQAPPPAGSPVDAAPALTPHGPEQQASEVPTEKFQFTFPDSVRKANDPKVVVIRELSEPEMSQAAKIGGDDNRAVGMAAVKASLYSVDGRIVDHGEFEAEAYWGKWGQKVKFQLLAGWRRVNQTSESEDAAFFESMKPV